MILNSKLDKLLESKSLNKYDIRENLQHIDIIFDNINNILECAEELIEDENGIRVAICRNINSGVNLPFRYKSWMITDIQQTFDKKFEVHIIRENHAS